MKKLFYLFPFLFLSIIAFGQISLPKLSPLQTIKQQVGLTEIDVVYSRPSRKGRTIFGDLVPYEKLWRTGANRNTKISFSENVKVGNQELPAGTYALFTLPTKSADWPIYFYTQTDNWNVPEIIDSTKIAAKITVKSQAQNRTIETLTFTFDDLRESSAKIGMQWENIYVGIPIEFSTNKVMDKIIEKELSRNATDYHLAAYYYLERNLDLQQAKNWIEKAILLRAEPDYRDYLQQSFILDKLGDRKGAIQAAKQSLKIAKAKGSKYGMEENTKSLKKWGVF